jgi:hypothetical protein
VLYGLIGRLGGFPGENETRRAHERKERALRVGVRLGSAYRRKGRTLRVRMRLGRARGRRGRALRVGIRLRRELRVRV